MVSQRCSLKTIDMYGSSAERFLSLIPNCCIPDLSEPESPSSLGISMIDPLTARNIVSKTATFKQTHFRLMKGVNKSTDYRSLQSRSKNTVHKVSPGKPATKLEQFETDYLDYLLDAKRDVLTCKRACSCWSARYDGENPPPDSEVTVAPEPISEAKHVIAVKRSDSIELEKLLESQRQNSDLPKYVIVNGTVSGEEIKGDLEKGQTESSKGGSSVLPRKDTVGSEGSEHTGSIGGRSNTISSFDSFCDNEVRVAIEHMKLGADLPLITDWRALSAEQFLSALKRVSTPDTLDTTVVEDSFHEIDTAEQYLEELSPIMQDEETSALSGSVNQSAEGSSECPEEQTISNVPDDESRNISTMLENEAAKSNVETGEQQTDKHSDTADAASTTISESQVPSGSSVNIPRDNFEDAFIATIPSTSGSERDEQIPPIPLSPLAARFNNPNIGESVNTCQSGALCRCERKTG